MASQSRAEPRPALRRLDLFHESKGLADPFDFATCGTGGFCGVGASFGQQNYGDIDPRVAFAWTPRKAGSTVIRGGFGTYHEDGQLNDPNLPAKNVVAYFYKERTHLRDEAQAAA